MELDWVSIFRDKDLQTPQSHYKPLRVTLALGKRKERTLRNKEIYQHKSLRVLCVSNSEGEKN